MIRPSRQSNRVQATLQRTVIGPLSADEGNTEIRCAFALRNPNHYFAISGNNLVTAQSGGWLRANTRSNALAMSATPTVWTMAALAPPSPSAITLTPASVTVANVDDQQHRFLRHLGARYRNGASAHLSRRRATDNRHYCLSRRTIIVHEFFNMNKKLFLAVPPMPCPAYRTNLGLGRSFGSDDLKRHPVKPYLLRRRPAEVIGALSTTLSSAH
jgi:hypothetical protein